MAKLQAKKTNRKQGSKTARRARATSARNGHSSQKAKAHGATRASAKGASNSTDILTLLEKDHRKVESLFERLSSTKSGSRRRELFEKIEQELKQHTELEENIFYPAFRDAARKKDDRQMYDEALEEHHVVEVIIPDARSANEETPAFAARAKVLKEVVEHHVEEEEEEMFPRARKLMSKAQLSELGEQYREQKGGDRRKGAFHTMASMVGLAD